MDLTNFTYLTEKQQDAYNAMKQGLNVFLTGPGGTGKSYLIKKFIQEYEKILDLDWSGTNDFIDKNPLQVTSTTGISSLLINGKTLHRFAGIGLGNYDGSYYVSKIKKNNKLKQRWLNTKVLIIDEVSMLSPDLLEKIDYIAKTLRGVQQRFGGIQLILSGDFLQLPPVNSDKFCFESPLWNELIDKTFYFQEIIRQDNKEFQSVLNKIRVGIVDDQVKTILDSCVGKDSSELLIEPTILLSTKKMVKEYNDKKLQDLGDVKKCIFKASYDFVNIKEEFKENYVETLNNSIDVNDNIELKIGTQVMLVINGLDDYLANGSVGKIINFDDGLPVVQFTNGIKKKIEYYRWSLLDDNEIKKKSEVQEPNVHKTQIPLILAWAITIHRAQGATLDYVKTDIGSSIFEYGQIYVVLSRVKTLDGLYIKNYGK